MEEQQITRATNAVPQTRFTRLAIKQAAYQHITVETKLVTVYPTDRLGKELR